MATLHCSHSRPRSTTALATLHKEKVKYKSSAALDMAMPPMDNDSGGETHVWGNDDDVAPARFVAAAPAEDRSAAKEVFSIPRPAEDITFLRIGRVANDSTSADFNLVDTKVNIQVASRNHGVLRVTRKGDSFEFDIQDTLNPKGNIPLKRTRIYRQGSQADADTELVELGPDSWSPLRHRDQVHFVPKGPPAACTVWTGAACQCTGHCVPESYKVLLYTFDKSTDLKYEEARKEAAKQQKEKEKRRTREREQQEQEAAAATEREKQENERREQEEEVNVRSSTDGAAGGKRTPDDYLEEDPSKRRKMMAL